MWIIIQASEEAPPKLRIEAMNGNKNMKSKERDF